MSSLLSSFTLRLTPKLVTGLMLLGAMRPLAAGAEIVPGLLCAARIALVSDPHTTRGMAEDQPLYSGRLERVIASINAAQVDLILIAGDLTQNGKPEEFADFREQVRGLHAPVRWVPGNHDVGNKLIPGKSTGPTPARLENYETAMGPSFWAETCGEVRVIGLNSQLFGSGAPRETEMWKLLEQETATPAIRPTVAFMHMPPFVSVVDEPGGDYWNIEPAPRARLLVLLKRGGVKLLLTGHLHYQLINHYDGLLIVTTAPVSFGLPRGVAPQGWTLVTVPAAGEARVEFQRVND